VVVKAKREGRWDHDKSAAVRGSGSGGDLGLAAGESWV